MAIQVQGTTVIDDSRNLVNVNNVDIASSQTSYLNLGTVTSGTISLSLSGNDFFTINVSGDITLNFTNIPTGKFKTAVIKLYYNTGTISYLTGNSIWSSSGAPTWLAGKTYIITVICDGSTPVRLNAAEYSA